MSGESVNAVGQLPPREGPGGSLDVPDLAGTWQDQLRDWLAEATEAGLAEPTGMVLATVDTDCAPSTRTVLAKTIDSRGVVFYTNYTSAKSRDLRVNQRASATFPWFALKRQVHVIGAVTQVSREESETYWATRPRGSQLGAWASPQSTIMSSRQTLENSLDAVTRQFRETEKIPLPRHWGGWLLRPERVEFWQGRPDRMHDRLRFDRTPDGGWVIRRLAP
jgi:pyridoxamine 5'-phosphate oxidase